MARTGYENLADVIMQIGSQYRARKHSTRMRKMEQEYDLAKLQKMLENEWDKLRTEYGFRAGEARKEREFKADESEADRKNRLEAARIMAAGKGQPKETKSAYGDIKRQFIEKAGQLTRVLLAGGVDAWNAEAVSMGFPRLTKEQYKQLTENNDLLRQYISSNLGRYYVTAWRDDIPEIESKFQAEGFLDPYNFTQEPQKRSKGDILKLMKQQNLSYGQAEEMYNKGEYELKKKQTPEPTEQVKEQAKAITPMGGGVTPPKIRSDINETNYAKTKNEMFESMDVAPVEDWRLTDRILKILDRLTKKRGKR